MPSGWGTIKERTMPNQFANSKLMYNVPIQMRDGVTLYCDVIRPDTQEPLPAILVRTSYYKEDVYAGTENWILNALQAAARGYNFVVQDTRGTGWSQGVSDPLGFEAEDGYDTIEAIAAMPWCDGNVGMVGFSFLGYCCMEAAKLNPPHLRAIVPGMCGYWKNPFLLRYGVPTAQNKKNDDAGAFEKAYQQVVEHLEDEAFFQRIGRVETYNCVRIPTLNFTGWMDMELNTTIDNYQGYKAQSATAEARNSTRLIIGPWLHDSALKGRYADQSFGQQASGIASKTGERILAWLDKYLKHKSSPYMEEKPVRLFIMGKNEWMETDVYPPHGMAYEKYYLHSDGRANGLQSTGKLTMTCPHDEPADQYLYDPAHPFQTIRLLSNEWFEDQTERENRQDLLLYTSEPFDKPKVLCGPVYLQLYAETTAVDTDFACRLLLMDPQGKAWHLQGNLIRARYRHGKTSEPITPGRIYEYTLLVGNVAREIPAGYALRIEVLSSLEPVAKRHSNLANPMGPEIQMAIQRIFHDEQHPSSLHLPVLS